MNGSNTSWNYGSEKCRYGNYWGEQGGNARNSSAISKMQHQYWVTKETVFRKLGKKEDANIVASDAELDAKLELFRSIQDSCLELQRIIDKYQERICFLAQEENSMGRFLKESGKHDKTGAGAVMSNLGKTMSHSGQQRISLRIPLLRLFQEVDTFRHRAIEDTLKTVQAMEKARTEYRASLSWMKDVSQELDPDTYKQMEKFRKVQEHVKQSKARFDRFKLDCLQKIDLLAAARCNMFSHALIVYHNSMLQFAKSSSQAFNGLSKTCKDHPQFEFSVIKELSDLQPEESGSPVQDKEQDDKLLNFEDLDKIEEPPADENKEGDLLATQEADVTSQYLPSQLLMQGSVSSFFSLSTANESDLKPEETSEKLKESTSKDLPANKQTKNSWLELFSELDPLSNPDSVGQNSSNEPLRNC